ncbi:MAG TPA: hypothetical protein VKB88_18290 [Bryobacteraceae bacterium]|nr:hypothetical protein [Bryobacteraceae bacterium]
MADETVATGTVTNWEAELEHSRLAAVRLLDSLARRLGASRPARYMRTHSAREIATGIQRAARGRPLYALAAAVAAGFLVGCVLKSSMRRG